MALINRTDVRIAVVRATDFCTLDKWPLYGSRTAATEPIMKGNYPPHSSDVHHEAEMFVALKSGGTNIAVKNALDHVYGYGLSLDMTRRD